MHKLFTNMCTHERIDKSEMHIDTHTYIHTDILWIEIKSYICIIYIL